MRSRGQIYIAGFLTWLSGFVDAVGFLALVQIYTANMSGNSVAIGIQIWNQNWIEVARRAWPVLVYVIGLMAGRVWLEIGGRRNIRSVAAAAFCVELVMLIPAALAHSLSRAQGISPVEFVLVALLTFAMGLQNATLTHFSSLTLHTGFVTGTLVKMCEQLTKKDFRTAALLGAIWTAYVVGAVSGAAAETFLNMRALFIAVGALGGLALVDLRYPIAAQDEQEQVKRP